MPATKDKRPGAQRIADERSRQVSAEGYDAKHDDEHDAGELALAAICYAAAGVERVFVRRDFARGVSYVDPWPWGNGDARPFGKAPTRAESIRMLEKAGALIAAEIDRLLRKEKK